MNTNNNIIKAENKSLRDLLDKNKYQVDPFQREYKWETEHIEELLVDLERAFKKNYDTDHTIVDASNYSIYYLGPIILYEKDGANHLIDGQQRLTSFTLLLIFLHHLQKQVLDKDNSDDFDTMIISKVLINKTFNLEIEDRTTVLKKIYEGDFEFKEADYIDNDSRRNIIERYADIESMFPPNLKEPEILPLFIYWIQRKLFFTEIRAFNDENAYTIFETMNDRGLQLTPSEMLKSYLMVKVKDPIKLKDLDNLWKLKMAELKKFDRVEEDSNFFKAWLKARYANSQTKEVDDFARINNRFHYWVKDNDKSFGLETQEDYYFFIKTNFQFYVDLYIKLRNYQFNTNNPEHILRLSFFKGVSPSLSLPIVLASVNVSDEESLIEEKINVIAKYLDNYAIYRLILSETIVQSSIDYTFNNLLIELRGAKADFLNEKFKEKLKELKERFNEIDYIPYDKGYSKYLLARIYKNYKPDVPFEDIYFMRKKDSLALYQFFKETEVDHITDKIPKKLKDLFLDNLVSYCLVPKSHTINYDKNNLATRIDLLLKNGYFPELSDMTFDPTQIQEFLINRNKVLKKNVKSIWNF